MTEATPPTANKKAIKIAIQADKPWQGKLIFDAPRHKTNMHMPLDWPRINQFPEWWTVQADETYSVREPAPQSPKTYTGKDLSDGIPIDLQPGVAHRFYIHRTDK